MSFKSAWILSIACGLLACSAQVDTTSEADGIEFVADEDVGLVGAALVSGTLPDGIELVDVPGGLNMTTSTPQGFGFSSTIATNAGFSDISNYTGYVLEAEVRNATTCRPTFGTRDYTILTTDHVTLRSGNVSRTTTNCNSGDKAVKTVSNFSRLYSDAPDHNDTLYCYTANAAITSDTANNTAPNGTLDLCQGLKFKNKRTSTSSGAMFTNVNGNGSWTISNLSMSVVCSGGGTHVKSWSPGAVAVGQTVTSTVRCPSGETVVRSTASFSQ